MTVYLGGFIAIDIEEKIRAYAKFRRVPIGEYEAFRRKVLDGLAGMGLSVKDIDIEQYKKVIKDGRNKEV